ncbi:MAG TPA: RNase III inhibitor [Kosmotogaceae bacterium]|nr:MAG: Appr-1-p processing domain protein [Thermotogales bacterium 46_20]HAA85403.1 RNase III inhibitor [Kosmotogaceae bacterium]
MKISICGVNLEILSGDIVEQQGFDAVVNAANAELRSGGGVAGAIHSAAGPELWKECKSMAPIKPGEAVITKAYELPNKHVIHCLGPIYGVDEPASELLARCYINALRLAEENSLHSIAFPAISAGAFGYPLREAASVAIKTVIGEIPKLNSIKDIRFVLFDDTARKVFEEVLEESLF